jgi:low affinity Fe/Cu permease
MVFLIQDAQNRNNSAPQLKLDELIRVTHARNRLMAIERLSEPELESATTNKGFFQGRRVK